MFAPKWAVYDLAVNPPAYDFLVFAQMALGKGAEAVWFVPSGREEEEEQNRLKDVAYQLCELFGLTRETGPLPEGLEIVWPDERCALRKIEGKTTPRNAKIRAHEVYWLKHLPKLFPPMPTQEAMDKANDVLKGKRPIVVVLRNAIERPLRNSSPDWRKWAMDHEAFVLEDSTITHLPVSERLAYYELSSLNIGVSSGQMHLNYLSGRPYLALRVVNNFYRDASPDWWNRNGFEIGEQMPWADERQKLVWNYEDDYDTIEREYQAYLRLSADKSSKTQCS